MNDSQPDLKSIQDNLNEAARLLNSLDDSDKAEDKLDGKNSDDYISPQSINASEFERNLLMMLSVGVVAIFSISIGVYFVQKLSETESKTLSSYNKKCGSIASKSGEWWPVLSPMKPYLGDSTSELLSRIKKEYCGDAFINNEGSLQVATFSTRKQAERFRDQISNSLNLTFRVGSTQY